MRGWLDGAWGGARMEERRFLLPAGNRKLLASCLSALSPSLSLSLPFSLVSICPCLFPLPPRPQLPSSPYLSEVEKWFLLEKAGEAFPSNVSSSLSNIVLLFLRITNIYIYIHILRLTLIAGNPAKHRVLISPASRGFDVPMFYSHF